MSTERQGGVIIFQCDKCPETYDATTGNFAEAWPEAKALGWRSFRQGTEWCHSCPVCVEDWKFKGDQR